MDIEQVGRRRQFRHRRTTPEVTRFVGSERAADNRHDIVAFSVAQSLMVPEGFWWYRYGYG